MKPLRRLLDSIHPHVAEGGKLRVAYPLYEALDTFLYSPGDVTKGPSHIRDAMDLKRMMGTVVLALGPCILMAMWNTGYQANLAIEHLRIDTAGLDNWRYPIIEALGVGFASTSMIANFVHGALYFLPVFLVTQIAGGFWEVVFATIRKHEVNEGFLVTGMLFPLTLPPDIPLWQVAIGISFGVVIGKEVFGGTGRNFLNPALTARAFLYFAYPISMSGASVWTAGFTAEGHSQATPLGAIPDASIASVQELGMGVLKETWFDSFLGCVQGSMGETSTLACLIGAAILIGTGIGSWRIMAGVLIGAIGFGFILNVIGSDTNPMMLMPWYWHLVVGGFAFGTVFMATDPVSAAMTETGKWIYGILIGFVTILIRVLNPAYAEGIMLAILFGNVFAPLIDYYVVQANIKRRQARNAE
ncbi:MAG: NADH:ubiquinone reductase (Na(+)-transporting) subunit B [Planctomycetota bacterium]|nr:NADH:ubiquinone reductase (Na(+)-transporting) subunit B [Planctomycetota bacterium]MDA1249260.1 NADH:ubiquinone reductase (Na(+)-transporting) subunit B [Planctomycetota bacterium]